MRIGDDVFGEPIAAGHVRVYQPVIKGALFRILDAMFQVAPLFVAERFPIRNEELQVARIRAVHVRVIQLVDDPVAQGEPDAATGVVRGADALFGAAGPARLGAGGAEGGRVFRAIHVKNKVDIQATLCCMLQVNPFWQQKPNNSFRSVMQTKSFVFLGLLSTTILTATAMAGPAPKATGLVPKTGADNPRALLDPRLAGA